MKDIIIALFFCLASLGASAQTDTTGPVFPDSVHISLPDSMHVTVLALAPDKSRVDIAQYQTWCAVNIQTITDSTGSRLATPGAWHTYKLPNKATLAYLYSSIGNYREGLVAYPNSVLQGMLMQQLYPRRMDVLAIIGQITQQNKADLQTIVQKEGINRIAQLKQ